MRRVGARWVPGCANGAGEDDSIADAGLRRGTKLRSIFHPSDFSQASEVAFRHALKIALTASAKLTILHVNASSSTDWQDFPGVRDILERWRLIPQGSPKSAMVELGINVEKVIAASKNPVEACLGFLGKHPTDLVVLAVRQYRDHMRWLEKSVGKSVASLN